MLPKIRRLNGRAVVTVVKRGNSLFGASLRIKWVFGKGSISRATVVTPIAFDKRATRRNRIKRQLREIIAPLLSRINGPVNLVIFVGPKASGKSFNEIKAELLILLKRARLL